MRFALVIPALNEEEAIAGTLRRALAARASVTAQTPVKDMTIVFVNDGSTDRTQEIVDQAEFKDVVKVRFPKNRGYGAAIKAGFCATDADLVGFIDADGTCDPEFCVNLINEMVRVNADVVLARRLEPNTQMPLIRKIGNRMFATLLGVMSGHTEITDTASGYRVLKRESLKLMCPLPDGLHFTPAMSCICLLDPRLKIQEVGGMHYKEREGRSKLSVIKDGFRFLYTILFSACCYAPIKTMLMATVMSTVVCAGLSLAAWWQGRNSLFASLFVLVGALLALVLMSSGVAVHEMNYLLIGPRRMAGPFERVLQAMLDFKRLIIGGMVVTAAGLAAMLVLAVTEYPRSHGWIWLMLGLMLVTAAGATAMVGGVVVRVIWAVGEKQKGLMQDLYRIEEGKSERPQAAAGGTRASVPQNHAVAAHH